MTGAISERARDNWSITVRRGRARPRYKARLPIVFHYDTRVKRDCDNDDDDDDVKIVAAYCFYAVLRRAPLYYASRAHNYRLRPRSLEGVLHRNGV